MPINSIITDTGGQIVKMLNFILPTFSFILTAAGLQIDWHYIALAVGGSVSGSVILSYFRREKSRYEQVYKMLTSAIGGLIVGSAVVSYRLMEVPSYIALTYFICSMLVLIILRTFISLTETNAATLTTTLIQRVFNIKLDEEIGGSQRREGGQSRRRKIDEVHVVTSANCPPVVIIPDTAKPDEIKVIEQSEIEKKEGI